MLRYFLITILLLIPVTFIQGIRSTEGDQKNVIGHHSASLLSWKKNLTNSYSIPSKALELAFDNYFELQEKDLVKVDTILTIIDFSKPSTDKRLYILDLKNQQVIKNTWVAHGKRSGVDIAEDFSNNRHSNKSSLGVFITSETYMGKHGYSLRLDGMNEGLNDNARKRAIVIHGADYVSERFIKNYGRLGRSFGCPAVPLDESKEIINLIKEGSFLFIYHPDIISKL